jgi:hypothetical protein
VRLTSLALISRAAGQTRLRRESKSSTRPKKLVTAPSSDSCGDGGVAAGDESCVLRLDSEWEEVECVGVWVGGCAFVCDVQDQSARSRWVVKGRVAVGRGEGCWPRQSADPDVFWVTWPRRGELREIRPHFALSVLFWLRVSRHRPPKSTCFLTSSLTNAHE